MQRKTMFIIMLVIVITIVVGCVVLGYWGFEKSFLAGRDALIGSGGGAKIMLR